MIQFNVTVPAHIADAVRARADSEGRSLSECAREALSAWLEGDSRDNLQDRVERLERQAAEMQEAHF